LWSDLLVTFFKEQKQLILFNDNKDSMQNFLQKYVDESKGIPAKIIYNEITDNRVKNAVFMLRQQ
jgi:hypothetical protein